jgi:hypothetical protein
VTVTETGHVITLIRAALGEDVPVKKVRDATIYLAGRTSQCLGAGPSSAEVAGIWNDRANAGGEPW